MADSPLDQLTTVSRRPLIHDSILNVKLPHAVKSLLKDEAERRGEDLSVVAREAIAEYLRRRGY